MNIQSGQEPPFHKLDVKINGFFGQASVIHKRLKIKFDLFLFVFKSVLIRPFLNIT